MEDIKIEINLYGSLIHDIWNRKGEYEEIKEKIRKLDCFNSPLMLVKLFFDMSVLESHSSEEDALGVSPQNRGEAFLELVESAKNASQFFDSEENVVSDLDDGRKLKILRDFYEILENNLQSFNDTIMRRGILSKKKRLRRKYRIVLKTWHRRRRKIEKCLEVTGRWGRRSVLPVRISFVATGPIGSAQSLGYEHHSPNRLHIAVNGLPKKVSYSTIIHEASHTFTLLRGASRRKWGNFFHEKMWWIDNENTGVYETPYLTFVESWNRACHMVLYEYVKGKYGIEDEDRPKKLLKKEKFSRLSKEYSEIQAEKKNDNANIRENAEKKEEWFIKKHKRFVESGFHYLVSENYPPWGCVDEIKKAYAAQRGDEVELPAIRNHQHFIARFLRDNQELLQRKRSEQE